MSKTTTLRRKQIEQIVATRHIVHVQALAKELLVSCETIRKDLAFLEEKVSYTVPMAEPENVPAISIFPTIFAHKNIFRKNDALPDKCRPFFMMMISSILTLAAQPLISVCF